MQHKTEEREFRKSLIRIALPVTLQSLLQSSFSIIDQVMIGQLGSASIAGIGLAGKFASLYSVVLGAVSAVAGIIAGAVYRTEKGTCAWQQLLQKHAPFVCNSRSVYACVRAVSDKDYVTVCE